MIGIVDYGLGNIHAFANIYKRLNIEAAIASTPQEVHSADRLILPGVGAFDWAMSKLDASGLRGALDDAVQERVTPVLGVCVGMQMMADRSDEGALPGLGWISGEVKRFDEQILVGNANLPHMGWNDVIPKCGNGLFRDLQPSARFYFLHSYYFEPANSENVLSKTDYSGVTYASSVYSGNVFGVQFHPEKSHCWGIQLLKNFAQISPC